jgi:hypothetical protein
VVPRTVSPPHRIFITLIFLTPVRVCASPRRHFSEISVDECGSVFPPFTISISSFIRPHPTPRPRKKFKMAQKEILKLAAPWCTHIPFAQLPPRESPAPALFIENSPSPAVHAPARTLLAVCAKSSDAGYLTYKTAILHADSQPPHRAKLSAPSHNPLRHNHLTSFRETRKLFRRKPLLRKTLRHQIRLLYDITLTGGFIFRHNTFADNNLRRHPLREGSQLL